MQSLSQVAIDHDLLELTRCLTKEKSFVKRLELVQNFSVTKKFLEREKSLKESILACTEMEKYVLYALLAIGQGETIFKNGQTAEFAELAKQLIPVEEFYLEIGGIVGYHVTCLHLLARKDVSEKKGKYHSPKAHNIAKCTDSVRESIVFGIRSLSGLAEIYPVGGAADRLSLRNERTGAFQIAATMEFAEKTLLERLIEDLQAREFLYWKLFGKQICVPVVLMSSAEKNGTKHLQQMLKEELWFGRRKEDFFLFSQPLVPTMSCLGQWCMVGPSELLLKPGGHGVIWKLAKESGALKWLKEKGKTKALMRQINNVIAGIDYGLLAFLGIGFQEGKDFGFAACPRAKGVSEGVNVVIETKEGFCLTNIEYCDFEHFQVEEEDLLANTNLLFVDLQTIEELLMKCPIPGMLVNAKKMKCKDHQGNMFEKEILRLESMMQNIADALVEEEMLQRTFITTNNRKKTISTIKKEFAFGSSMLQTPEQCYLDLLENARDLLENFCGFDVLSLQDPLSFFWDGPPFIFLYHPALGPQYEIIAQKLKNGRLAMGAEVKLQISDLYVENLDVDGSLQITSDAIMGHRDEEGILHYSDQTGKCILKNVLVRNSGINREASRSFWKDEIVHKEKCEIFIEESGEFYAEDVTLRGDLRIRVPSGVKVSAFMEAGRLKFHQEILKKPSWNWVYAISEIHSMQLKMKKSE